MLVNCKCDYVQTIFCYLWPFYQAYTDWRQPKATYTHTVQLIEKEHVLGGKGLLKMTSLDLPLTLKFVTIFFFLLELWEVIKKKKKIDLRMYGACSSETIFFFIFFMIDLIEFENLFVYMSC